MNHDTAQNSSLESRIHHHDVLVVGGGLTGLRAAMQADDAGLDVVIISKVNPLRSHSVAAQGGMNASLGNVKGEDDAEDSWEMHAYDTVKGSDYLADQDAVEIMCKEAPRSVIELEHLGTVWSRLENGKIAQRPFGGAGFPRTCYAADRTGHNALHTLFEQVVARKIPVYDEFFVTSLVTCDGNCVGLTAIDIKTGDIHGFSSKATLLATGGFGRIFKRSTNAIINTADGQALAMDAGVPLKDMEFVQFHPTTLYGTNILMSEGARGEGGILLNKNGERFMERYAPNSMDLAPRDVVARSIEQEILEGRAYDPGYVYLDLTHLGSDRIKERLPGIRQIAMDFAGVDPIEKPVPIQPGQHYSMGGIDVDHEGSTIVKGLFAAGECSCISVHGANRLGGNSLLETVVFGRLVADKIIEEIQNIEKPEEEPLRDAVRTMENKIEQILQRDGGEKFFSIKTDLNMTMQEKFGIFRDHDIMEEGLSKIGQLKERFSNSCFDNREHNYNQALIQFLELESMLKIAEVVAVGAIERRESRGSHKRNDYPDRDDENFLKHTLVSLKDGELILNYKPVKLGIFKPKERVY